MEYKSLESIAGLFTLPEVKVISFDVFDTLLLRPVRTEQEKFALLDACFRNELDAHVSFARLRTMAEASLRRKIIRHELPGEDFSIDQICQVLAEEFGLGAETAAKMLQAERDLEARLCSPRKSGRFLYEKAVASGRRVVLLSDMYLTGADLARLLACCGYPGNPEIYVSSETGLRKSTGSMFRALPGLVGAEPSQILHIGDSLASDVEPAGAAGIHAVHLPGTMETFERYGCARQAQKICRDLTDWEKALREPGISIMRKMAANRYFDDPFRPFVQDSDYNQDPWFVGYAALGPEVLSLVRWLSDGIVRDRAERILFLARDGYLPMQAYRILRRYHPHLPDCGYLRVSRLAMLPVMIRHPLDLYDLPVDITRQTPEKLMKLLSFCGGKESLDGVPEDRLYRGGEAFTPESFQQFIGDFIRLYYDGKKHEQARTRIRDYLLHNAEAPVTEGAALFDMGYSGRIAQAVREAAGTAAPVFFFHGDGARQFLCEGQGGFSIRAFFDFSPYMEATMREYAYLEAAPSCIGYSDTLEPVFDCGPAEHYKDPVLAMQKGALDLVRDYLELFSGYEYETSFRNHNGAMPFEAFLRFCRESDRKIYEDVVIDDELWGGRRDIRLRDLMEARLRKLPDFTRV